MVFLQARKEYGGWLIFLFSALVSLPFLTPCRWYPDSGMIPAIVAVTLSSLLIISVFRSYRFSAEFFCLIYLMALFLIQGTLYPDYYYRWVAYVLSLLVMAFLLAGVQALREKPSQLAFKAIVSGVVVGGVVSAVIALVQFYAPPRSLWNIILLAPLSEGHIHGEPGGNLAQRNHQATYLMIAAVMLIYAVQRVWISRFSAWLLLPFIALMIALTTSRTAFVEMVFLAFFCVGLHYWKGRQIDVVSINEAKLFPAFRLNGNNPLLLFTIFVFCFLIFQFILYLSGSARLSTSYGVSSGRIAEWIKILSIIKDHPFGVGQDYSLYSAVYALNEQGSAELRNQVWANTHNLILQLLVMFGVWTIPLIVAGLFLYWRMFKEDMVRGSGGVIFLCLSFILIHSMFEFPLWNLAFFALFVVLWGLLSAGSEQPKKSVKTRTPALFAVVGLILAIGTGMQFYRLSRYYLPTFNLDEDTKRVTELWRISMNPLLSQDSDVFLLDYLIIAGDSDWQFKYCKTLFYLRVTPAPALFERLALQSLAVDRYDEASSILKARYMLYPDRNDVYLRNMMRYSFPVQAESFLNKIDRDRFAGFPGVKPFLMEYPDFCKPEQR